MTLQDLTDAHVRALIDPPGSWENRWQPDLMPGDWGHAYEAGLVGWSEGTGAFVTFNGKAIIAEAQRIADGLSPREVSIMTDEASAFYTDEVERLVELGLLTKTKGPPFSKYDETPAARLVLALRERSR